MKNKIVEKLKLLLNFGISDSENLTNEDRVNRMQEFRKTLTVEYYYDFFQEVQEFIINENISVEDKGEIILLTLRFVNDYVPLRENISKLPEIIIKLNESNEIFNRIMFYLQELVSSEVTKPYLFEEGIKLYFDFLDNPINEFFIHNCYSRIDEFNKKILKYLDTMDIDGNLHKDIINNPELIATLKERIDILENSR